MATAATLGRLRADREPRRIETGAATLDAEKYAEFRKIARPTNRELVKPGDVILIEEFEGGAIVATVRTWARKGPCIVLNGMAKGSTIPVLAIAAVNFGEQK